MADENPVRFGILGCANIARKLSRAINLSPTSSLHAVASRSIEKARQFAAKNGLSQSVKLYGSYGELVDDPLVDAVYMPLPTSLHVHWAVLAARRKKHVLVEKPAALDLDELDRILEACESNGVQFMDASMWFHHPRTKHMKDLLSDPALFGQVKAIHSSSSFNAPPEFLENDIRSKPDLDGLGALGDLGWYCIGAIMWGMNLKPPSKVIALPAVTKNSAGVILACCASLHWEEEQTVATFHCSFLSHTTTELTVHGSNGTIYCQDFIIPMEETSAAFTFTSGTKFVDLHIGWNVKPRVVEAPSPLPQEALMVDEFSRIVKGIKASGRKPDEKWPQEH